MCKEAFLGSFEVMSGNTWRKSGKPREISFGIAGVSRMGSEPGSLWIQDGRFIARARVIGGAVCCCKSVLLRHCCSMYFMIEYNEIIRNVKLFPSNPMRTDWGRRGIAPFVLNLGSVWEWVFFFASRLVTLSQGLKRYSHWIDRLVDPEHVWTGLANMTPYSLLGFEPRMVQPFARRYTDCAGPAFTPELRVFRKLVVSKAGHH
jgi:hypothetical protein